jgi:hypothetical protein
VSAGSASSAAAVIASSIAARIVGSLYTVAGLTIAGAKPMSGVLPADQVDAATREDRGPADRHNATSPLNPPSLLQLGPVTAGQTTLPPGATVTAVVLAYFPIRSSIYRG